MSAPTLTSPQTADADQLAAPFINWVIGTKSLDWAYGNTARRLASRLGAYRHAVNHKSATDIAVVFDTIIAKRYSASARACGRVAAWVPEAADVQLPLLLVVARGEALDRPLSDLAFADPVRRTVTALLADAQIEAVVFDAHTSIIEGSIGALPRRLMVLDTDLSRARHVLETAGEHFDQ